MTVTPLGRDQDCILKNRELDVPAPWFLDPGGWSKTATVSLYFIFPGICTLSHGVGYLDVGNCLAVLILGPNLLSEFLSKYPTSYWHFMGSFYRCCAVDVVDIGQLKDDYEQANQN
ncbi:hypothetical protein STEG23_006809 [Scotinomys teguina]